MLKCLQIIRLVSKYDQDQSFIIRSGSKYDQDPSFLMSRLFFVMSVTDVMIDILNTLIVTTFLCVYCYRR